MIVLYRVRRGQANEQLRFSLRSLANLQAGQHEVWMVGSPPPWVRNVHVIAGRPRFKWHALNHDLRTAALELAGHDFVLMDDDFFILDHVDELPVLHAGQLVEHAKTKAGSYARTLLRTADWLAEHHGISDPLSYELHRPMVMNADCVSELLEPALYSSRPLQARTLYGNAMEIGGQKADDVKVGRHGMALPSPFASTSPASWSWIGAQIRAQLPEPSAYE